MTCLLLFFVRSDDSLHLPQWMESCKVLVFTISTQLNGVRL